MDQSKKKVATTEIGDDFARKTGMKIEQVIQLYQRAVENDWRTVQATAQQAITRFAASRATASEAAELLALSHAILAGENGDHLSRAGLVNPA